MSFTISTDVFCDECGNWDHGATGNAPDRKSAWKLVRKTYGWKLVKGKHICPVCNKAAHSKHPEYGYSYVKGGYK